MNENNNQKKCCKCWKNFPKNETVKYSGSIMCEPCGKKYTQTSWSFMIGVLLTVVFLIGAVAFFMRWAMKDDQKDND